MKRLLTIIFVTAVLCGAGFVYLWMADKKAAEEIVDNGAELNSAGIRDIRAEIASGEALSGSVLSGDVLSGAIASGIVLSGGSMSGVVMPSTGGQTATGTSGLTQ